MTKKESSRKKNQIFKQRVSFPLITVLLMLACSTLQLTEYNRPNYSSSVENFGNVDYFYDELNDDIFLTGLENDRAGLYRFSTDIGPRVYDIIWRTNGFSWNGDPQHFTH